MPLDWCIGCGTRRLICCRRWWNWIPSARNISTGSIWAPLGQQQIQPKFTQVQKKINDVYFWGLTLMIKHCHVHIWNTEVNESIQAKRDIIKISELGQNSAENKLYKLMKRAFNFFLGNKINYYKSNFLKETVIVFNEYGKIS